MKFAAFLFVFAAFVALSTGLECYKCNSVESCKNLTDEKLTQCSPEQTFCFAFKDREGGHYIQSRGCSTVDECAVNEPNPWISCRVCQSDKCNN